MHIITKPVTLSTILHIITESFAVMKLLLIGFQKKKNSHIIEVYMHTNLVKNNSDQRQSHTRKSKLDLSSKNKDPNFNLGQRHPYLSGEENIITYFGVIKAESHLVKCKVINLNVLHSLLNANLADISRDRSSKLKSYTVSTITHCNLLFN